MNFRTRKVSEIDVDGLTAELSFEPSCLMSYVEHKIEKQGGMVAVGYLVDDHDVENPLDDCDGMGHIYSSHRHSGQHAKMQAVLGLDSNWQRDLSLRVVEREAESALKELVRIRFQVDLVAFILECANNNGMSRDQAIEYFVVDFTGQIPYHRETWLTEKVRELVTWDSFLDEAWQLARLSGQVGDPHTVMLDCYEHGGQVWSVTGSGQQCLFDTARGAGVWVPERQKRIVATCMNGEERQYFFDKMVEIAATVEGMPVTYQQDGKGDEAIAHLHYFLGDCHWYITEKDREGEVEQAFG
ncbi:MAG: hypothetical protein ABIK08_04745 [Pseudomonadota bacterium]